MDFSDSESDGAVTANSSMESGVEIEDPTTTIDLGLPPLKKKRARGIIATNYLSQPSYHALLYVDLISS